MSNKFDTKKISESTTENIFRNFYGSQSFIEKAAIPKSYGFVSKAGTNLMKYSIICLITK